MTNSMKDALASPLANVSKEKIMPIFRFTALAMTLGLLSAPYNVLAATSNPAFDPKNLMQSEIYHFAQSNPLADFSSDKNSTLTLSDKRSVMGSQSLLWKWKGGSSFTLHKKLIVPTDKEASKAWGRASTPVLSFWLYNEKPIDGYLTIDF